VETLYFTVGNILFTYMNKPFREGPHIMCSLLIYYDSY